MFRKKKTFNDRPVSIPDVGKTKIVEEVQKYDKLGLTDYASALAEFVSVCETPMTIGIQGDWGIGKTSILNMIKTFIEGQIFKNNKKGSRNGIVWFNTWQYSLFHQDEFLGAAVINSLLESIKQSFDVPEDLMKRGKDSIGKLLKTLSAISIGGVSIDPTKMTESSSQSEILGYADISSIMLNFKNDFEELIDKVVESNKLHRVVIFIDDLDRVKPIKALELLESIKNFLDVKHCVFVVAVDYEVIQTGMSKKLGQDIQKISGKSFFDKIIQLPFNMPTTSYRLEDYVQNLLHESEFTGKRIIKDDEKAFYAAITACTVGRNPRSIKRVINYAKLLDIIRGKNSTSTVTIKDRQILYALICMQIAWPEIFSHFVNFPYPETISNLEDWEYLDNIPKINKLYDRTPDVDQLKNNISSFFDLLFDIIDEDGNGSIDKKEFIPIWNILKTVKLTSIESFKQPFDELYEKVLGYDGKNRFKAFMQAFAKSKWKNGHEISYKSSGTRYFTIVMNRKQVGSIVSLKTAPIIFRLKMNDDDLISKLETKTQNLNLKEILQPIQNTKLTGFGNTVLNIDAIDSLPQVNVIRFLNQLYDVLVQENMTI